MFFVRFFVCETAPFLYFSRMLGIRAAESRRARKHSNKDHFMAALLMPVMMYFCRIRNRNTMGIIAITAPAMISL